MFAGIDNRFGGLGGFFLENLQNQNCRGINMSNLTFCQEA
ncbi:hypothetical protein D3OALGA1CA_5703 [Olavius algarvensis associated proteobacterium Delta 3]|nr:hypothetical protein D3OALGB2SA_2472 [Olavius algarvensis associated proteobacterium Delta 3]CAB5170567.1 hypothetical protein D3OALGA1CA_5703 [Olavius algarvensis associated proteobacterium Delta 3]